MGDQLHEETSDKEKMYIYIAKILYNWNIWWSFKFSGLTNVMMITKLIVNHVNCKQGFLSIQYSKPPI